MQIDQKYQKSIQKSLHFFQILQEKQTTILFRCIRNFFIAQQTKIRLKESINQKQQENKRIIFSLFKVIQKCDSSIIVFKNWKLLFFIHGTILFSSPKIMSQKVITFLTEKLQKIHNMISLNQVQVDNNKNFFNRSLQVIKKSLSKSKQKIKFANKQEVNLNQASKQFINQSLLQYIKYLKKILSDIQSYYQINLKEFKQQAQNVQIDSKLMVWRCINILKLQSQITKKFSHFNKFWPQTLKYTLCTINMLATDSMNMYFTMSFYIKSQIKQLRQKYDFKPFQKSEKNLHEVKLKELKQNSLIFELKNIIDAVFQINDGINYQFFGIEHYKLIQHVKLPKSFLKTDNQQICFFFQLFEQIQKLSNVFAKRQAKQNLFSLKAKKNIALGYHFS